MMEVKAYKWAGRRVISPGMKKVKVRVTGKVTTVKLLGNWCLCGKTSLKSWSVAHLVIRAHLSGSCGICFQSYKWYGMDP